MRLFSMHHTSAAKVVGVADIGSGSAGFALARISPGKPAVVLAARRTTLPLEERSKATAASGVVTALRDSAKAVLAEYQAKHKGSVPSQLICVLRSPWSQAQAVDQRAHFSKETRVTRDVLKDLARRALEKASDAIHSDFLGVDVAYTELNGYPVRSAEGESARDIRLTALVTAADKDLRSALTHVFEELLPQCKVLYRGGERALLRSIRKLLPLDDYMVVDMGGEGSVILAVRSGAPEERALAPEGVYSVLRSISRNGMPEESLSLIRMMARDHCTGDACDAVSAGLAKLEPELVRVFGECMATCAKTRRLPDKLVLVTHPDMSGWFSSFFSRIDFTQFTRTAQPFTVTAIDEKVLSPLVDSAESVKLDAGLSTAIALADIEASGT